MAGDVEKFWKAFERETGEKVEAQSEGTWFRTEDAGSDGRDIWGLLILTDKSFRFKYVPETFETAMMRNGIRSSEPDGQPEFIVPRGDIVSVCSRKQGFFKRVIRPGFPRCAVVTGGRNGAKTYVVSADPSSGLVAALKKVFACTGSDRR